MSQAVAKNMAEPEGVRQAVEFVRQAVAKKSSSGFYGTVRVTLSFERGEITLVEMDDKVTYKPIKK